MAKRRTKKQKQEAKHTFSVKWESGSSIIKFEPSVNSQFKKTDSSSISESDFKKSAVNSVQYQEVKSIKKNIYKSLIISSLILVSEAVLYLIWK